MKRINVAAAALNQTALDWNRNLARAIRAVEEARQRDVAVLCLPELCLCGYGCEDAFHSPDVIETASTVLREFLPHTKGMIVAVGHPLLTEFGLLDAACLIADGEPLGFTGKQHLASDGLHYEPRWFKACPSGAVTEVRLGDRSLPAGDVTFQFGDLGIGFEICEDAWAPDRPAPRLVQRGVDLILNPSASHFAFSKFEERQRLVLEATRAFGVAYVYANLVGNEAGRSIYDGGSIIAAAGEPLAYGRRFVFDDVEITSAAVDLDALRLARTRVAPEIDPSDPTVIRTSARARESSDTAPRAVVTPAWESGPHLKEEEFTRALGLGLFDYLRKSRSHGFVVSLSGGADSTATACLVALMVRLILTEHGRDLLDRKLDYIDGLSDCADADLVHALLTCVYQSTRNSSTTTRDAARTVAESIGAKFHVLDVEPLVQGYRSLVEASLDRDLTWEQDDVALQNIQARVRGPSVWMLANLERSLLLATSNRSEAAVGYTTMDGDTCGGLSPIAGIDKAFLRHWLRWLADVGPDGIGPIGAVAAVNALEPTAELRPRAAGQTDETDLMPYDILDRVERLAIRDKKSPLQILLAMRDDVGVPIAQLATWIERFFRLWCMNQWKRERFAPSFHLDEENLDPKTWCRYPILSGGAERELNELREYVQKTTSETVEP